MSFPEAGDVMSPHEPIDEATLASLREPQVGGEPDFLIELIDEFLRETPNELAALRAIVAQRDAETLARRAHRLKGGCGVFGARLMTELCGNLEGLGRAGSMGGADGLLAQLESEFDRVRSALEAEKAKAIPSS